MAVPYQIDISWSQKSEQATRAAEFHCGKVNHITSDEAQQAQDVVLGIFLQAHILQLFYSILEHIIHS
jgi:hypothetical protein